MKEGDTIAAIATAPGKAAIAVVRMSGPQAVGIADRVFRGRVKLSQAEAWQVYLGRIVDPAAGKGGFVDQVLATVFRCPKSYTGEDVVEFSCHGGFYLSHRILQLLIDAGARLAEPGEFTRRAFLNGRLDLSQAEAVADLIAAKTASAMQVCGAQLQGALSRRVSVLRNKLIELCSLVELQLDFSEEDISVVESATLGALLEQSLEEIRGLVASYRRGRILREGARTVIIGRPNVGKSSLLNALLRQERAIVTPVPGTTRDTLEEQVDIRGVLFRLVDTAGIHPTTDPVEAEGVRRTEESLSAADLVVWVVDASEGEKGIDADIVSRLSQLRAESAVDPSILVVVNKIDLLEDNGVLARVRRRINQWPVVAISATELLGFEHLEAELVRSVMGKELARDDVVVVDERHRIALDESAAALERAISSFEQGLSGEFIAVDLHTALDHLGEIIGVVGVEDILDHIFSRFCIGK